MFLSQIVLKWRGRDVAYRNLCEALPWLQELIAALEFVIALV